MAKVEHDVDEIIADNSGRGANLLWDYVCYCEPDLSFEAKKERFFEIVKLLLEDGRMRIAKPDADVYFNPSQGRYPLQTVADTETHWIAPSQEILAWLRGKWPPGVKEEADPELTFYFFEIPTLIWKEEGGRWNGT